MPGVLSARWSGRHGDDEANLRLLLAQLADVPDERRGAQFVCAAALVLPGGREHVSEGVMRGRLIREPRGQNGFGYDPIFVPESADITTAEMDAGRQGQDQPPRQGLAGACPGNRRVPWLISILTIGGEGNEHGRGTPGSR